MKQQQVVCIIQIEMVHMFRSLIEQIQQCLNGKLIVAIHLTVSIQVVQCYSMFKMQIGSMVHTIIYYFRVEQHLVMCFVLLNLHPSQVLVVV